MKFYKYSGSGNDFIFISEMDGKLTLDAEQITSLCCRKEGIGADGVVLIGPSNDYDYSFRIFNSDGSEPEMCGNAARCSIHFASNILKLKKQTSYQFETMNGVYEGEVQDTEIKVKMTELYDVDAISISDLCGKNSMYLNTGVPHAIIQVSNVEDVNVKSVGAAIRNDPRFPGGTNVDFLEVIDSDKQMIKLRVFERGVEDETLCCGTGIIAAGVACAKFFGWEGEIQVQARGGNLKAIIDKELENLYFQGPVKCVFSGELWDKD